LNNYFADPDNDTITFSVISGNRNIVDVFTSSNQFIVKPKTLGSTTLSFTIKDSHGAVLNDIITVLVDGTNGITNEENDEIKVFPNPTNGYFYVTLPQGTDANTSIIITNILGSVLYEARTDNASGPIKLDISDYPNGIYFIQLKGTDMIKTEKIIKN